VTVIHRASRPAIPASTKALSSNPTASFPLVPHAPLVLSTHSKRKCTYATPFQRFFRTLRGPFKPLHNIETGQGASTGASLPFDRQEGFDRVASAPELAQTLQRERRPPHGAVHLQNHPQNRSQCIFDPRRALFFLSRRSEKSNERRSAESRVRMKWRPGTPKPPTIEIGRSGKA
jgi:hypothetical protein